MDVDVKTVLLLEDDADVMKVLRLVLRRKGYVLFQAMSAEVALGPKCAKHIDLLIADVSPPCYGIHVACQLKAWIPDVQIILTSGYPTDMWDEQQRVELSEIPSDSVRVLRKPFLPGELLRMIVERIGPALEVSTASAAV
jgi:DNA-binding response OmpR family regulator